MEGEERGRKEGGGARVCNISLLGKGEGLKWSESLELLR